MLRIQLLGEFRLAVDDQPVLTLQRPRQQALLAYLLLHRHAPQARQRAAFCFWPDSSEAQAFTNLRKLFFQLRRSLPHADDFLVADAQQLGWQPNAPYALDVAELEHALDELDHGGAPDVLQVEKVVALYAGELLPACYEDWILPLRRALHERVVNTLEQALVGLAAQRTYAPALRAAEHLRRLDPLHEATYRHLMHLRALSGDRPGALRIYHECVTILEQELAVPPAAETRALYEHLLKVEPAEAPPDVPPAPSAVQIPLVGRQPEWQILQQAWQASGHGPGLVTVWGEAGVGKTRLVEELVRWARLRPGSVAYARSYAAEGGLAYAPIAEWLRAEPWRTVLAQADKVWLAELARLLPELQRQHRDLPPPLPLREGWQRQRFFEAMARMILAAPPPLLLVLDDLQWCDAETLAWLRYLLRLDPQARLLVVGTVRGEEVDEQHPLHELRRQVQRTGQDRALELAPLNEEETAALAGYLADADITGWTPQLYRETEGNPLFVVEMVRAGYKTGGGEARDGQTVALPPTVQAVIATRLAQISPTARQLTQVAAVIGRAFTLDVLAAVSKTGEDLLVRGLDELWQRRIVRERGPGYDFSHDKIREVAYAAISPMRRSLLHRQVADVLEQLYAPDLGEVAGQLATHYRLAGQITKALTYLLHAGEGAKRLSANQEALRYYQQALALAQASRADLRRDRQTDADAHQRILAKRAGLYLDLYQGQAAVADFQCLLDRARETGDREQELEFLLGLIHAYRVVAYDDQEVSVARTLRELHTTAKRMARELDNRRQLVQALLVPIWNFWPDLRSQTIADAKEALALSGELGDAELMIESKLALLYCASEQEQAAVGDGLLADLQARRDLDRLNRAYFYLMWTHYHLGNFRRMVSLCDAGIAVAAQIEVPPVVYPTLKAMALLSLGQFADAWAALQQEVADAAHVFGRTFQETGIGMYLLELGAYVEAATLLERVMVQAGRLQRGWLCEWARLQLVRALLRAGRVHASEWTRAAQALAAADANVLQGLNPWQAQARALKAELALVQGRPEDALREIQAANALMAANGYQAQLASAWELEARILLQLQQPTEALARLDAAWQLATAIEYVALTWRIRTTQAQTLAACGQTETAAQAWQAAAVIIRQLAATIADGQRRQSFLCEPLIASVLEFTPLDSSGSAA